MDRAGSLRARARRGAPARPPALSRGAARGERRGAEGEGGVLRVRAGPARRPGGGRAARPREARQQRAGARRRGAERAPPAAAAAAARGEPPAAAAATKRARDLGEDAAPPRGAAELAAGQAAGRLPGSRGGGEPALEAADERRFVGVRVFGGGGAMGWVEEGAMGPRVETTRLGFRLARRARWPSTPVLSKGNRRARKKGPPCRTHPRWTSSHVPLQQQGATSLFAKEALAPSSAPRLSPPQQMRHVGLLLLLCSSSSYPAAAAAGCASGGLGDSAGAGAGAAAGRGMV